MRTRESPAPSSTGDAMPQRSKIERLPEKVRKELESRLIKNGFGSYVEMSEWLKERGFEISKSALHNWGQGYEARLQALKVATDQAKAIAEASEDDAGAMNEALIRLVQTKTFEILVELEDVKGADLSKIGLMVARITRASVNQKKWAEEARKQALNEAADTVEATAKRQGVSEDTIAMIRRDLLGMSDD